MQMGLIPEVIDGEGEAGARERAPLDIEGIEASGYTSAVNGDRPPGMKTGSGQRCGAIAGLLFCLFVLLPCKGDGQRAAAPSSASERADGLIHLDALVTNSSGTPVTGLKGNDFTLLDNGKPETILSFQGFDGVVAKADPPVKILLVIDTLGVPEELARSERVAVESYLEENGGHLTHPTSVLLLTDLRFWTLSRPSTDGRVLAGEIRHGELHLVRQVLSGFIDSQGQHDVESAGWSALKAIGQIATAERRVPGRKLLLWVGPGWNIGSGAPGNSQKGSEDLFYTIRWFRALLREARLVLYSFSVGEKETRAYLWKEFLPDVDSVKAAKTGDLNRKVLAIQSGGRVLDERHDILTNIRAALRRRMLFILSRSTLRTPITPTSFTR